MHAVVVQQPICLQKIELARRLKFSNDYFQFVKVGASASHTCFATHWMRMPDAATKAARNPPHAVPVSARVSCLPAHFTVKQIPGWRRRQSYGFAPLA